MKIARVFTRKTSHTPDDDMAFLTEPEHAGVLPDADEVHVSVSFSYDVPKAEQLAEAWGRFYPTKIGGPAVGTRSGEFTPGMYLKPGYVVTSRGCPNKCWFCKVWRRDGTIRELDVKDGWIVQDDNLLACSDSHVQAVFDMLARQREAGRQVRFTGGLEAKLLQWWHVDALWRLRPEVYFAYDTSDDLEPLREAGRMMRYADFPRGKCHCYVLIGHPRDTMRAAERRIFQTWEAGFLPYAMLWRDDKGNCREDWKAIQRTWVMPALMKNWMRDNHHRYALEM